VDRVDFDGRRITVDASASEVRGEVHIGSPKTTAGERTITVPRFLLEILQEQVTRFPTDSALVFSSHQAARSARTSSANASSSRLRQQSHCGNHGTNGLRICRGSGGARRGRTGGRSLLREPGAIGRDLEHPPPWMSGVRVVSGIGT
jgi:hypothetical protein